MFGQFSAICCTLRQVSRFRRALAYAAHREQKLMSLQIQQNCLGPVLVALPCYSNTSTSQQLANCFCPNLQAQATVASCVQSHCNNTELDISGKLGHAWCAGQPVESRSHELIVTVILCAVFVAIFISLRAWSRFITGYKLGWDDWTLGIATVAIFAFLAIQIPNADKGTGKHFWDVDPDESEDLLKVCIVI